MTDFLRALTGAGAGVVVLAAVCLAIQNNLSPVVFSQGTNPSTLLLLRFAALVAVMAAWCRASGRGMVLEGGDVLPGYVAGLLFAVASGLVLTSFALIPVSLAILIIYTQPIITFLAECALDRRAPRPILVLCLLGAFAGLAMALQVSVEDLDPTGLACAAGGALCITLALLTAGRLVKDARSSALTLHMAIVGLIFAAAFTFIPGQFALEQTRPGEWMVLAVAILLFGTGFFGLFTGTRQVGASAATQIMNLEPVLTVILAVAFFGEAMSPLQGAGAALVVACVALTQWVRVREPVPR